MASRFSLGRNDKRGTRPTLERLIAHSKGHERTVRMALRVMSEHFLCVLMAQCLSIRHVALYHEETDR